MLNLRITNFCRTNPGRSVLGRLSVDLDLVTNFKVEQLSGNGAAIDLIIIVSLRSAIASIIGDAITYRQR